MKEIDVNVVQKIGTLYLSHVFCIIWQFLETALLIRYLVGHILIIIWNKERRYI